MGNRHVGSVLVTGPSGTLLGIFTGRDAVRALGRGRSGGDAIRTAMTPSPEVISSGSTSVEAFELMQDRGFRHLPVVDAGRVVRVLSWGDFRADNDTIAPAAGSWE